MRQSSSVDDDDHDDYHSTWFLVLTLFCNVNVAMKENGLEKTILEAQKLTMTCITAYTKGWHIYILNLLYHNLIQYK